jgi:hypothetical protein
LIKNGQTKGNNRFINGYKNELPDKLSPKAFSWSVGLVLSDATLQRNLSVSNPTTRFKIQQAGFNRELLDATQDILKPWVMEIYDNQKPDKNLELNTLQGKAFNPLTDLFQDSNVELKPGGCVKKVIPPNIKDFLDPICLSSWFCGDRTTEFREMEFCTHGFSQQCNEILAQALQERYGWKTIVQFDYYSEPQQRHMFFIKIKTESCDSFCELMEPMILPTFKRKLPDPRIRRSRWST